MGQGWTQLCTLPRSENAKVIFRECGFLLAQELLNGHLSCLLSIPRRNYPVLCRFSFPSSPKKLVFRTLGKPYPFIMPATHLVIPAASPKKGSFPQQADPVICFHHSGIPWGTQEAKLRQCTSPQGPKISISQEFQMTEYEATGLRGKGIKAASSFLFITIISC